MKETLYILCLKIIGVFSDILGLIFTNKISYVEHFFLFNRDITKNAIGEHISDIKNKLKHQINTKIHYSHVFISDEDIWFHSDGN